MAPLARTVSLVFVIAASGVSTRTTDFDDYIQTLSISAEDPKPLKDIEWSTSVEVEFAEDALVAQLGALKLENLRPSRGEFEFLLPTKYIGDISGFYDSSGLTSIHLVLVSLLREFGFISDAEIFAKLKLRLPRAQASLCDVSKRLEAIRLPIAIPSWFYDTLAEVGSMGHGAIMKRLRGISGETRVAVLSKVAKVWIRNCFSAMYLNRLYPACIAVEGGWTLTAPQISGYLMDLEIEELVNLTQTRNRESAAEKNWMEANLQSGN